MPLPPLPRPPDAELQDTLRLLGLDAERAARCVKSTLRWLSEVGSAKELLAEVRRHPLPARGSVRSQSIGEGPVGGPEQLAKAIIAARPYENVQELAAVDGVDAAALAQLIHVGCELAPPPPQPPKPVVGVLLPLRLETRFAPPVGLAGWKLRVRIVPDAPSVDSHDPEPSEVELDSTETMWRNCGADLSTDQAKAEWGRFAARHGAARAGWLARTFPPKIVGGEITIDRPATTRSEPRFSQVAGLPPTLELWLARGGGAAARVATLTVDRSQLQLDFPDPDSGEERWWASFAKAVEVGLGTEIDLGSRADDLDVLYVIGLGGGDPAPLFHSHRDRGGLSVLPIGAPTNTVDGEPAADLARDPETWRELVPAGGATEPGAALVSLALTGNADALSPLPGAANDPSPLNHLLVEALWPSVFGHGLKDVLGLGAGAENAGVWALDNLLPEGPVPPLRVGEQPYGVLPVTSLTAWKPAPGDPGVEEAMRPSLASLRSAWARAAEARGTAVGADTGALLDLLGRTPASPAFCWRWFVPLELLHHLAWAYGSGVPWAKEVPWWDETAVKVAAFPVNPGPRYATLGYPQDLAIPLVEPDNLAPDDTLKDLLARMAAAPPKILVTGQRELFERLPNSLLIRLILHALIVTAAEVARTAKEETAPLLEPAFVASTVAPVMVEWATRMTPTQLDGRAASALYKAARDGAANLAAFAPAEIERAFKATLDTASHRLDPWITGLAWRRLRDLQSPRFELGAYGWVDAPRPRGAGGPAFPNEFLHAPSQDQALTAAILRDRSLSDAEPGRWHMDLHSDRVRAAERLAAEVRLGAHLSEALGRAVERAIGDRATVERLRADFPIRTEHEGRRVCDGQAVLASFASDPGSLALTPAQLDALSPLAEVVDVYGDLLVADAVFDVVSGRGERAASSMEAAAGLSVPPNLDVIRTQRLGRGVNTSVVVALPAAAAPAVVDASTSPGRVADPAVAAFLDTAFGAPDGPAWTWQVTDDSGAVTGSLTLAALDLAPVDTLGLSAEDLERAVLEATGAAGVLPRGGLNAHRRVRRMADVLGSQPAVAADLADGDDVPDDTAVHADLLARYTSLHGAADLLRSALQVAAGGSDADRRSALHAALRWGITPLALDGDTLPSRVDRALEALDGRLRAAPAVADAASRSVPELARAIAELAAAEGRVPVLARHSLDALPVTLTPEPATASATRDDLDPDWLEVAAAVRGPVARLEAYQCEQRAGAGAPFAAWANRPGDPWQAALPADSIEGLVAPTKLVAAFGPAGALDPGSDPARSVAIGLLDSWGETIPATEHATGVAFHFDAPGARAPQAILVAVPPVVEKPLDTATLARIVAETRELSHARMATPAELDAFAAALPLTLLPSNPPAGVSLFPA